MFGSVVLEVAIGVAFIYLLMSLIVSAANELIASVLMWRARTLEQGIRNLLEGKDKTGLTELLYNHPLVKGLYEEGKRPSYIPSRTFALALLDLATNGAGGAVQTLDETRDAVMKSSAHDHVKEALRVLIDGVRSDVRRTGNDVAKVQESVETWFNNSMERVAGWYKRKTQMMMLVLSLVLAVFLNLDTILIARSLAADTSLRASFVALAEHAATAPPDSSAAPVPAPSDEQVIENTRLAADRVAGGITELMATGVPIGWYETVPPGKWGTFYWFILKLLGLAFTALAVSLGAPFWFDMLNKFVTIRSTGKAPEEAPKAPKEVPTPLEPGQWAGLADAINKGNLVTDLAEQPARKRAVGVPAGKAKRSSVASR